MVWRVVCSAALAGVLGGGGRAQDRAGGAGADVPPILPIGAHAPSFSLPGVDGKTHRLEDYASSEVLAVVFTCDHCPVAQMYEKRIKQLTADYSGRSVAIVAINFIFDERRSLQYEGRIDSNVREQLATKHEARDAIEALLAGRPVAVKNAPAVGCSTKWAYKEAGAKAEVEQSDRESVALEIVTVSVNNPDEHRFVRAFLEEHHAINRNLLFNGADPADAVSGFGTDWAGGLPYTALLGMNGEVLFRTQGRMNALEVRRAILRNVTDDRYIGQHAYWNSTF